MKINAASRLLAGRVEDEIRKQLEEKVNAIGKPTPVTVVINGVKRLFVVRLDKLPTSIQQNKGFKSTFHLMTVKKGRMLRGDPESWIADYYVLDGKNQLKPDRILPHTLTDKEVQTFFKHFGLKVPSEK